MQGYQFIISIKKNKLIMFVYDINAQPFYGDLCIKNIVPFLTSKMLKKPRTFKIIISFSIVQGKNAIKLPNYR